MTSLFTTHIKELLTRLIYILFSWTLSALIAYKFKKNILLWITFEIFNKDIDIIYLDLPEALWNFLLISIWFSFLIIFPWAILNIYAYFRSALFNYKAHYWDYFILIIVIGWIPYQLWQIKNIWYYLVNWFLSYGDQYENLSYLPTMNQFFSFLLNWSVYSSVFLLLLLSLIYHVLNSNKKATKIYYLHRDKIVLFLLFLAGIITPPDLVSQIFITILILIILEIITILNCLKLAYINFEN